MTEPLGVVVRDTATITKAYQLTVRLTRQTDGGIYIYTAYPELPRR